MLQEYALYMCNWEFNAAEFLDHQWFQNGLYAAINCALII